MLPWFVGVLFIAGLCIFLYLIRPARNSQVKRVETIQIPKKEDIVLAELTDPNGDQDFGILWNGIAGETYNYTIHSPEAEIASGTATSNSTVFKVKGLPLEIGETYKVKVGDTEVEILFLPPSFDLHSLVISENRIDCNTSSTPTNIEVIGETQKIPMSDIQIKIEPPGFIVNHPVEGNNVIMIYNGRNSANILTLSIGNKTEHDIVSGEGETPVTF